MKFADYHIAAELKTNLEKQGFRRPTDIQFKAIPPKKLIKEHEKETAEYLAKTKKKKR